MALSNIKIEPKREIIESAIGITALLIISILWVQAGMWFQVYTGGSRTWDVYHASPSPGCPWPLGMVLIAFSIFLVYVCLWSLLHITHYLGESLCAGLVRLDWDPRPKKRYVQIKVYVPGKGYVKEIIPASEPA